MIKKISGMKLKEKTILVVLLLLGAAVLISSVTFCALYERMRELSLIFWQKTVHIPLLSHGKRETENFIC